MSHEGIRIVSADEAQAANREGERLPVRRGHAAEGPGEEDRGHRRRDRLARRPRSSWNFRWLRDACPCATCHEERESTGRPPGEPKPKAQALLVMYQEPPRPVEVTPVGKYALRFKWNDGHEAGIYSWDYLRRVCTCNLCKPPAQPNASRPSSRSASSTVSATSTISRFFGFSIPCSTQ